MNPFNRCAGIRIAAVSMLFAGGAALAPVVVQETAKAIFASMTAEQFQRRSRRFDARHCAGKTARSTLSELRTRSPVIDEIHGHVARGAWIDFIRVECSGHSKNATMLDVTPLVAGSRPCACHMESANFELAPCNQATPDLHRPSMKQRIAPRSATKQRTAPIVASRGCATTGAGSSRIRSCALWLRRATALSRPHWRPCLQRGSRHQSQVRGCA